MTLETRTDAQIPGGWLAYCARARDVERDESCKQRDKTDDKRNLTGEHNLANRG